VSDPFRSAGVKGGRNREDLRKHNLSAILDLLHRHGTLSRAQLTSTTGLNRTTVSYLVGELVELGLAVESKQSTPTGVGRPSVMVSPRDDVVSFALHVALDATTVGIVSLSGKVLTKASRPNPANISAAAAVQIANELIAQLRDGLNSKTRIVGVGVAIPGQIRVAEGIVRFAPAFTWVDVPFGPMLSQLCKLPVFIDNDASLGCLAERIYGSARGFSNIVYLFGGANGIGGGVVIDGQRLRGAAGYAGELGHLRISNSAQRDFSELPGTLEAIVRRDILLKELRFKEASEEQLEQAILSANTPEQVRIIEGQIDCLAIGIANFVNVFNPEAVILAGFLGALFKYDADRLMAAFRLQALVASQELVVVRSGEIGGDLLMIGAAELPIHNLVQDPAGISLYHARKKR